MNLPFLAKQSPKSKIFKPGNPTHRQRKQILPMHQVRFNLFFSISSSLICNQSVDTIFKRGFLDKNQSSGDHDKEKKMRVQREIQASPNLQKSITNADND